MAEKRGGLLVIPGSRATVTVPDNRAGGGGTPRELSGIGTIQFEPGTDGSTTINALEGSSVVTTSGDIGEISVTVNSYVPALLGWEVVREAYEGKASLDVQIKTRVESVKVGASTDTFQLPKADIDGLGSDKIIVGPTFAGIFPAEFSKGLYQRGQAIHVGSRLFIIQSISDDATPVVMVSKPDLSALDGTADEVASATKFDVIRPSLTWNVPCNVTKLVGFEVGAEEGSVVSGTATFAPTVRVGKPTLSAT